MKTTSVMIQSLCLPCFNRCRYCLLSWNGVVDGAAWDKSIGIAERFLQELKTALPSVNSYFTIGYSMEHPDLREAIQTLRRLNSPMANFLQCDGMKMRDEVECNELMEMLHDEGIKKLNFTIYGLPDYHDSFARRKGDFNLLIRLMMAARKTDIPFTTGIPLTSENVSQVEELAHLLKHEGCNDISLFIPHEEGRGKDISHIRLSYNEYIQLPETVRPLLNRDIYRPESEWLNEAEPVHEKERLIIVSLRPENIAEYESRSAISVVSEIEKLDEQYYESFPSFCQLAETYGKPDSDRMYRIRDLYHHYRSMYAKDNDLQIYDVTDERQSGSRRF